MTDQQVTGLPEATKGVKKPPPLPPGMLNRIIRGLLATPGVSQKIGSELITLYFVGRKTGKRYATPVAYVRHEGYLLFGTTSKWGRNLRTGEQVTIRLKGRRTPADVQVLTEEKDVSEAYAIMAGHNPNFARLNSIGFDAAGNPVPADLHRAWAAGARAFRLTPG